MVDFTRHHPNTAVNRNYKGNKKYAYTFRGEADKLLYQLRNAMSFNGLMHMRMTRIFMDGTVITAWSVKNRITSTYIDFVEVDVTHSRLYRVGAESCTLTLIDLPDTVIPMQHPGEIQEGELEGVDYIKTYYLLDAAKCRHCDEEPTVTFLFQFLTPATEHAEGDAEEHCIYSDDGACSAEVIDQGTEEDGRKYFRWKAYTEGAGASATGYGHVKLTAEIENTEEKVVCDFIKVISVNCCAKEEANREVSIEYTSLTMDCSEEQTLEASGGCLPYTWNIQSGGGTIVPSADTKSAVYTSPATNENCNNNPTIVLTDRCGMTDDITISLNCAEGEAGYRIRWLFMNSCLCSGHTIYVYWIYKTLIYCDGSESAESWYSQPIYPDADGGIPTSADTRCMNFGAGEICHDSCFMPGSCPVAGGSGGTIEFKTGSTETIYQGVHDTRTAEQKLLGCCPPQLM